MLHKYIQAEMLAPRVKALDYLVALGTHRPMSEEALSHLLGCPVSDGRAGRSRVFNHEGQHPDALALLGTLSGSEIAELTEGRLSEDVPVRLNRLVLTTTSSCRPGARAT